MLPILYSFRRCPYAMRARMAISYSRTVCELREVVLKNKPQAMLDASPKATVPVIVLDGVVIDESIDIMAWALGKSDPDGWLSHTLDHHLIQRNDGEFKRKLDRYKYFEHYPEQSQDWYFEQTLSFLNDLEASLTKSNQPNYFLESPCVTALDVAIFPFIRQFAFVDKPRFDSLELPKLKAWLAFFLESNLFLNVMNKYPAWVEGQEDNVLFAT